MSKAIWGLLVGLGLAGTAHAHDTWVQTNSNAVRVGDAAHVDLMLGNHGNDHRDFKLAGKPDLAASTLEVVLPSGKRLDIKPGLTDQGYAPSEGFWSTRFVPFEPGLYTVSHTYDKVVSYAPVRSIKSAKTCFVANGSLDNVPRNFGGFDQPLGHPLELVPKTHPVTPMGPGVPFTVRLLYRDKPLAGPGSRSFRGGRPWPKASMQDSNERPTKRAKRVSRPATETIIWSSLITKNRARADRTTSGRSTAPRWSCWCPSFVPAASKPARAAHLFSTRRLTETPTIWYCTSILVQ